MLDKSAGKKQVSKVENINKFKLLQGQLDEFVEKETIATDAVEHAENGAASQHRLDEFIDGLQQQMDACVKQGHQPKAKKEIATDKKAAVSGGKRSGIPANSGNNISRLIIAAVAMIVAVLWFAWPSATVAPPEQLVAGNGRTVEKTSESMDKAAAVIAEPVVELEKKAVLILPEPAVITDVVTKPEVSIENPAPAVVPVMPAKVKSNLLTVTAALGNVRRGPNTAAEVLFRLKKGTVVAVLKREGDWLQVRINGTKAWAHHSIF